jgi:F420H(2)-dependent quinone reductase
MAKTLNLTIVAVGVETEEKRDNLRTDPNAAIYVDRKEKKIKARVGAGEERALLWEELGKMLPPYLQYQTLTTRGIPLVILE